MHIPHNVRISSRFRPSFRGTAGGERGGEKGREKGRTEDHGQGLDYATIKKVASYSLSHYPSPFPTHRLWGAVGERGEEKKKKKGKKEKGKVGIRGPKTNTLFCPVLRIRDPSLSELSFVSYTINRRGARVRREKRRKKKSKRKIK